MTKEGGIRVEVAFARPERQRIIEVIVPEGATCLDAVRLSGIVDEFPEIDPEGSAMGIFGKEVSEPGLHSLSDGDRVEIYRPLIIDPKRARLARARGDRDSSTQ